MARVADLTPGDLVTLAPLGSAVFVTSCRHPLYPMLQLVIWRLLPGREWSLDALHMQQTIGQLAESTPYERVSRLREAMTG